MNPANWGFTISEVPYWGPYYKGILLFGDLKGSIVIANPQFVHRSVATPLGATSSFHELAESERAAGQSCSIVFLQMLRTRLLSLLQE